LSAPNNTSLEEFIAQGNNEIILGCNNSQQRSLAVLNRIGQQLQQAIQLLTKEQEESRRLRVLCEKNKIDTKIVTKIDTKPVAKSPPKDNKIAPVPTAK